MKLILQFYIEDFVKHELVIFRHCSEHTLKHSVTLLFICMANLNLAKCTSHMHRGRKSSLIIDKLYLCLWLFMLRKSLKKSFCV